MDEFKKRKDYFHPLKNHWERQKSYELSLSLSLTHAKQEEKPIRKESKCMNGRFQARVRSLKHHKTETELSVL
jgi:hypothetical protein